MPIGTIALTNNSPNVVGTGTTFNNDLKVNDFIVVVVGQIAYQVAVKSVNSNTSATLVLNYDGPTASGLAWNPVSPATLGVLSQSAAADTARAFRQHQRWAENWQKLLTTNGPVTINNPDGSTTNGIGWPALDAAKANKSDFDALSTAVTGKVSKSGDTMTGPLTISNSSNSGKMVLNSLTAGQANFIMFQDAGTNFAFVGKGGPGDDFRIWKYSSQTGVIIGSTGITSTANFYTPARILAPTFDVGTDLEGSTIAFPQVRLFSNRVASSVVGGRAILQNAGTALSFIFQRADGDTSGAMTLLVPQVNGTIATTTSDKNLKDEIGDVDPEDALTRLLQLQPIEYKWNELAVGDGNNTEAYRSKPRRGFFAQHANHVDAAYAMEPRSDGEFWGIDDKAIIADLVAVVKKQAADIEGLKMALASLQEPSS